MKKSDLKTGMIVEFRKGTTALVAINNCYGDNAFIKSESDWSPFDSYDDDLKWSFMYKDPSLDIIKVYKPELPTNFLDRDDLKLIWERKEEKKCPYNFKKGDCVMVTMNCQNASSFNLKTHPVEGIYSLENWREITFTIDGDVKFYDGGKYMPDDWCYLLKYKNKEIGYVYGKVLKKVSEPIYVIDGVEYSESTLKSMIKKATN